jgi:tetratricopeptide (TPR) repeat protein
MTATGFRQLALCLALIGAFAMRTQPHTLGRPQRSPWPQPNLCATQRPRRLEISPQRPQRFAEKLVRKTGCCDFAAQSGGLHPSRTGLTPVHHPDLAELEPNVRDQLISFQNSLAAQAKDSATTDLKLSEAYGLMGRVYQAYSLTSPAKECYLNASHLAPKDFRWTYLLANICQQEGRVEEALSYYRIARGLRPDYLATPVNLGNLYLQQNRLEEARSRFREALALNPHCTAARYGLGQVALSLRNYAEAVEYLEQALTEAPEATRIHYALAMAYRGLGNIQKAQAHLQQQGPVGVRVADRLVDDLQELIQGERLHLVRGRIAFDALRFSEAADEFRKAVAANPASIPARVNLGSTLAQIGDVRGATEQYQEAIRISPSNAAAHYNLGLLLAKQNQHDQAILHFQSVLGLNPKDSETRYQLAQQLLNTGRSEEALAEFSRVVESDPDNEEALLERVKLLFSKKQYKQALEGLEKGNALFPQKGRTAALLAYLLASSPQYDLRDGARALALSKLVYESTGQVNHGAIVAMALAELGRCSEAAQWQRQMIAIAERDRNMDIAAKLKTELKRYEGLQQCRPQGDGGISASPLQDEIKRPRIPESR